MSAPTASKPTVSVSCRYIIKLHTGWKQHKIPYMIIVSFARGVRLRSALARTPTPPCLALPDGRATTFAPACHCKCRRLRCAKQTRLAGTFK